MIIKRNTHAPFRLPRILIKPEALRYEVEFTESCRYRFGTDDDADVNKLFGITFVTLGAIWFVLKSYYTALVTRNWSKRRKLHHYNSIRWGWRYDALSGRIELLEYSYSNGYRNMHHYKSLNIGDKVSLSIEGSFDLWEFKFNGVSYSYDDPIIGTFHLTPNTWLCYELHPYFGGNRTAPHDMEIKMKRI